jgi:Fe/S biogenesis protein NfuA
VELVDVQDSRVYLQMGGGCQGCGAADITLKAGIERLLKEEIPEILEVLDTTDHASGTSPYYASGKA